MDGQVDRMTPGGQSQQESRPRDGTADIYPASQSQTSYNQYSQSQHPEFLGVATTVSSLTGEPRTNRKYAQEQKDEFFVVFDRLKSTGAAARELGLSPDTCAGWVRKAGLKSHGKPGARPHRGRDEYFRLRKAGLSRREAAAAVSVHTRTAAEWDLGIRKSGGRRIYADGRVVDYKRGVTTMTSPALAPPTAALEKLIDPRFLSVQEREMIRDLKASGSSMRAIASALGRSASTISRELGRNADALLGYLPHGAQRKAAARRARPKTAKLAGESDLRDYVRPSCSYAGLRSRSATPWSKSSPTNRRCV